MQNIRVKFHGLSSTGAMVGKVVADTVRRPEGDERVGMTAFVPFAPPDDEAEVAVTTTHRRHLEGTLTTLPGGACTHFTTCGGCDLQHIEYTRQLSLKREMVRGAFQKGGLGQVEVGEVVASTPYGWRRRVTLHVGRKGEIGYRPRGTHDLIVVNECPVAHPVIEEFLTRGFTLPATLPHGGTLYLEVGDDGLLYGMLRTGMLDKAGMLASAEAMDERLAGGVVEVAKTSEIRFGQVDSHPTLGSFSQANGEINARLQEAVVAGAGGAETALDLYAGAGNFAFPLVRAGLGVTAVEADIALVTAARDRARTEGISERLQVVQKRVEVYLKGETAPTGYLVVDPPRAGLGALAQRLTFAPKMALISCDLAVGVRDLNALRGVGWEIESVQPFDMFPQTAHIEILALCTRRT